MGLVFLLLLKPTTSTTTISISFLFLLATALFFPAAADPNHLLQTHVSAQLAGDNVSTANPFPSPPAPPLRPDPRVTSFRPTIAIIVGVLTTLFSITFLLLLYAKHCKRGGFVVISGGGGNSTSGLSGPDLRKNSGIDRSVVESLPVFRFGSLRGQKTGLDCAVCLTRFGPTDVLRLLPKCKHAFHVECVDTWLDAHSTCPLCRYRVDPEDVLLIDDAAKILHQKSNDVVVEIENDPAIRRVSGRHSFAGAAAEQKPGQGFLTASFRRSLDSWASFKRKKPDPATANGCLDRPRKDGLLLGHQDRTKFEHRIIVSPGSEPALVGPHQRWSDVQPSDLLYLRSEMILSEGLSLPPRQRNENNHNVRVQAIAAVPAESVGQAESVGPGGVYGPGRRSWSCGGGGSSVINSRSVSEITGLSRFSNREPRRSNEGLSHHEQRQLKLVSRWLAWVASLSRPGVRAERTTTTTTTATPPTTSITPPQPIS